MNPTPLPITNDTERIRVEHGALLKERDAADLLGVEVRTLQSWRLTGTGPHYVKLGDAPNAPVRYPAAKLRAFLERHTIRTAPLGGSSTPAASPPRSSSPPPPSPSKAATAAPTPKDGLTELRTVKRLAEELAHCGITESSIRWSIFNGKRNGLETSGALVRPPNSRRLFIDRDKWEAWMRSRSEPGDSTPTRGRTPAARRGHRRP